MRYLNIFVFSIFCTFTFPAVAGPGHSHDGGHSHGPIEKSEAIEKASKVVLQLVERKKIDSSWSELNANKAEKKDFGKGPEWVVSFNNNKIKDASKKTLYVFLTIEGRYLAANYTGQ